ncbi:hypothetical protein J5N55_10210 [Acinetobacter haemolyticus]|uniref:Uncharacterized protein n=1 Tax=Acinetobacter haemolyticus TaxID=29430 RepID=A0AAW4JER4_ACIHA|nr:hypothetical protein [Acinetobacter haemolyticus]MBO3658450.1 hypothetical protein [Acinetobacter haemolyticus]
MQFTPLDAGLHLKEQFDELFSRRDTLEQQRTQITKLQNDLKAKDSDVIGLSAQIKQLSDRTDVQALMKENKNLIELNLELRQKMNDERQQVFIRKPWNTSLGKAMEMPDLKLLEKKAWILLKSFMFINKSMNVINLVQLNW